MPPASQASSSSRSDLRALRSRRRRAWWAGALVLAGAAGLVAFRAWAPNGEAASRPVASQGAAVTIEPVRRGDMLVRRTYPGEVFADAVDVSSRIAGHVASVAVRIGDVVEAGAELARIDDAILARQLRESQARIAAQRTLVATAEINVRAAKRDRQRALKLAPRGVVSRQELDELSTAQEQREAELATAKARLQEEQARAAILRADREDTVVRAPFAGVVARRDVEPGAFVAVGASLLRLVARAPLRVRFRVPEVDLEGLRPDLPLVVATRGFDPTIGRVTRLSGEVSSDRTLEVEGIVPEPDGIRPGMYADIEVEIASLHDALVVPDAAVLDRIEADGSHEVGVFAAHDGHARWVPVRVLAREGSRVAVAPTPETALTDGDAVLVRGHRELSDGATVRVVDAGERS